MALTPVDILHTQFKPSLRGYNRQQVDAFLRSVREALEEALDQRNELQRRVQYLESEVERVRGIESTMTTALTLAQKTADELRTNAHRQAEMILREAEQERVRMNVEAQKEAEKCRGQVTLLQATRSRLESELRAVLTLYLDWLDKGWPTEVVAREQDTETTQELPELSSPLAGEGWGEGETPQSSEAA